MTAMLSRGKIALALLIGAMAVAGWQLVRPHGRVYQGRKLSAWMKDALSDDQAKWLLANRVWLNLRPGSPQESFQAVLEEAVPLVIRALKTKDNSLWKPYTALRQKTPASLASLLPEWREPQRVRAAAAYWLGHLSDSEPKSALPALCGAVNNDPSPVVRALGFEALCNIGVDSPEVFPIMVRALSSATNRDERVQAAEWFKRATPNPEKATPALIDSLSDASGPSPGDECARALAAYGPRATCGVGRLETLARTNNDAIAWRAFHALAYIDPPAARRTGVRWSRSPLYTELWRTNQVVRTGYAVPVNLNQMVTGSGEKLQLK